MHIWHTSAALKMLLLQFHKDCQQQQSQLTPPGILIYEQQYVHSARTALTLLLIMFVYCTCMYAQWRLW